MTRFLVLTLFAQFFFVVAAVADETNSNFHFQSTIISQQHAAFKSPYSGQNSLTDGYDNQTSITWTIFMGQRLWHGAEFYFNPELAGGSGFSQTHGVAGFPNGEIYRVDDGIPQWNLARLYARQTFGLGGEQETIKDDKNQISGTVDVKRLTITFGKFALNDFFDNNSYAHDPRTQFMNWSFMDNAAWDYAADTRGYSWGLFIELNHPKWALRFATALEPKFANEMQMDKNYPTKRGDNLEFEYRYNWREQPGVLRFLAFENHADMGNYRAALNTTSTPDITLSRSVRTKYGFGLNFEQAISKDWGVFSRASWNDGLNETWAFTEVDETLSLGASFSGRLWHRANDVVGAGLIANGLSMDHREYLTRGGYGFLIGDGRLNYSPEEIAELYYLFKMKEGFDLTGDYQFIQNPGYNSDRGPVTVLSMRVHYEL